MARVYDEASEVSNHDGVVMVDGPDGVAVALTPEAAVKIGADLIAHAAAAKGEVAIKAGKKKRKT